MKWPLTNKAYMLCCARLSATVMKVYCSLSDESYTKGGSHDMQRREDDINIPNAKRIKGVSLNSSIMREIA